jgi:hypothetical protein
MDIEVQEACDSITIVIDDEGYYIDQEDSAEQLVYAFRKANPTANVVYKEIY